MNFPRSVLRSLGLAEKPRFKMELPEKIIIHQQWIRICIEIFEILRETNGESLDLQSSSAFTRDLRDPPP
jgi:hypothetical protein